MAVTHCPECGGAIAEADINVREGAALCRGCDELWKLRDLAKRQDSAESEGAGRPEEITGAEMPSEVPRGCWLRDSGTEVVLGARCLSGRTIYDAIFAVVWNSIVWTWFTGAFIELYSYIAGAPPRWLNWLGQSTSPSNPPSGMAALSFVALIPFVLVGAVIAGLAAVGVFGKVVITIRGRDSMAFTGIGTLGWKRRFAANLVRAVKNEYVNVVINGRRYRVIVIEADEQIRIGLLLSDTRRDWIAGALQKVLAKDK